MYTVVYWKIIFVIIAFFPCVFWLLFFFYLKIFPNFSNVSWSSLKFFASVATVQWSIYIQAETHVTLKGNKKLEGKRSWRMFSNSSIRYITSHPTIMEYTKTIKTLWYVRIVRESTGHPASLLKIKPINTFVLLNGMLACIVPSMAIAGGAVRRRFHFVLDSSTSPYPQSLAYRLYTPPRARFLI